MREVSYDDIPSLARTEIGIIAFQTYHHRHLNTHFFHSIHNPICNQIATHNTAEDIY